MKNDVFESNGSRKPDNFSAGEENSFKPPGNGHFFLEGIARIVRAMKPKRFMSYRRKKINKDGSVVETEFIYRDDH